MTSLDHAARLQYGTAPQQAPCTRVGGSSTSDAPLVVTSIRQLQNQPTIIPSIQVLRHELSTALHKLRQAYQSMALDLQNLLSEEIHLAADTRVSPLMLQPLLAATRSVRLLVDRSEYLPLPVMPLRYPLVIDIHYLEQVLDNALITIQAIQRSDVRGARSSSMLRKAQHCLHKVVDAYNDALAQMESLIEQSYMLEDLAEQVRPLRAVGRLEAATSSGH